MTASEATILVVEDEESFIEALTVGLKREGFRVRVARDGVQALEQFDLVQPDLVLLDVMLPLISGVDVCREIRTRSKVPSRAAVEVMTGPRVVRRRRRSRSSTTPSSSRSDGVACPPTSSAPVRPLPRARGGHAA